MDYPRPVEAVIPGATGRLLAALARVEAELPVSMAIVAALIDDSGTLPRRRQLVKATAK
ncbi:MAG: hypothetical protein ACLQNG_04090 [Acidimicrobiales bacterium]|jgi:hypothetical protein